MNFPPNEYGCLVCLGVSKTKCNFCRFKRPKKNECSKEEWDAYEAWEQSIKYLKTTRLKLKVENMVTSGCPELDEKIIYYLGRWTTQRIVTFVSSVDLPDGPFCTQVKVKLYSEVKRMFDGRVRLVNVEYKDIKVFNCIFDGKEKAIKECVKFLINNLFDNLDAYM